MAAENKSSRRIASQLSVAIITRNRKNDVLKCLTCLRNQTTYPKQLIIVEDVTEKQHLSLQFLRSFFRYQLECIYIKKRNGKYANSRNLALKECKTTHLVFLDDDVSFDPTLLHKFELLHQQYPAAAAFVGKVLTTSSDLFAQFGQQYMNFHTAQTKKMKSIPSFTFTTTSLNLKKIHKHHLSFNESFYTGEDVVFFRQLTAKREKLFFHPSLEVKHRFVSNPFRFFQKHFRYGKDFIHQFQVFGEKEKIRRYIPQRKLELLLFPFFTFSLVWSMTKDTLNHYSLPQKFILPAFLAHFANTLGVYSSPEWQALIQKKFPQLFSFLPL